MCIRDSTKTGDFVKTDIATWDAEDFHKKIGELYLHSIKNEKLLQQTKPVSYTHLTLPTSDLV